MSKINNLLNSIEKYDLKWLIKLWNNIKCQFIKFILKKYLPIYWIVRTFFTGKIHIIVNEGLSN